MNNTKHKTIVIGSGPGGSSAAIYLARFNHEVLLFDAHKEIPGRTFHALQLENVLGFRGPKPGPEFLDDIHHQLHRFGVERKEELVTHVTVKDNTFTVSTNKSAHYEADYVIVAVGVHDIMPDVPEIEQYFGKSVFQCPTCNWYQTKDQNTGIVANDDAGITTALVFDTMQKGSCLFVAPDRPRPHYSDAMIDKAAARGIRVFQAPIICLNGHQGKLHSVRLADEVELEVEILYTKLGVKRLDMFFDPETLPVKRDADGYIDVNFRTLETSIPHLYAVGPCNNGPDQVMVAAGQGVSAAMSIHGDILDRII